MRSLIAHLNIKQFTKLQYSSHKSSIPIIHNLNNVIYENPYNNNNEDEEDKEEYLYKDTLEIHQYNLIKKYVIIVKDNKYSEHYQGWLSGFTSGDGCFIITHDYYCLYSITLKKNEWRTIEIINWHLDNELNISINKSKYNTIIIKTTSQFVILKYLVPIFNKYPIITNKFYAYEEWHNSLIHYFKNHNTDYSKKLRDNYNLNIDLISDTVIPYDKLNNSIVLGFIEAEGCFSIHAIKNSWRVEISISQNEISNHVLHAINNHIINNWEAIPSTPKIVLNSINNVKELHNVVTSSYVTKINKHGKINQISKLRYTQLDFLYYVVIPNLEKMPWYTLKFTNIIILKLTISIIIKGLYHTQEGKDLLSLLKKCSNKDLLLKDLPWDIIDKVINIKPIYDINLPYKNNSKNYMLSIKNNKFIKSGVYIYNLNHEFIITVGGQDNTAKYFKVPKHIIIKHLDSDIIFLNKYYLKRLK